MKALLEANSGNAQRRTLEVVASTTSHARRTFSALPGFYRDVRLVCMFTQRAPEVRWRNVRSKFCLAVDG
eukprot:25502-Eustigmatos_ZCMA.PRE.1